jgi:hypothetical protein
MINLPAIGGLSDLLHQYEHLWLFRLATKQHSQPLPILSEDSHGKKCSGEEPKIYVLIVMNDLLQGINVKGHTYLCWKDAMAVILSYVTMILKNN